jgi:hypothetical protein
MKSLGYGIVQVNRLRVGWKRIVLAVALAALFSGCVTQQPSGIDVHRCDSLSGDTIAQGYCYINLSIETHNPWVCQNLAAAQTSYYQPTRDTCFMEYAEQTGDKTVCDRMLTKANRDQCKLQGTNQSVNSTTTTKTTTSPGGYQPTMTMPPSCGDTDGGIDSARRGTATYSILSQGGPSYILGNTDYCIDSGTVREYSCDCLEEYRPGCSVEKINHEDISCPFGCVDGACKSLL